MATNFKKLITALITNQMQDLENKSRELFFRLDINRMEGAQLDKIGEIIGQNRLGYNDTFYRILIKVKIGINNSEGELERIITLWKLLTSSTYVEVRERFPAKVKLVTTTDLGSDLFTLIKDIAQQVLAGGVGIDTIFVTDPTRFGFAPGRGKFGSKWVESY
jgi:hypothetical protein